MKTSAVAWPENQQTPQHNEEEHDERIRYPGSWAPQKCKATNGLLVKRHEWVK